MGRRLKVALDCPLGSFCDPASTSYQSMGNNRLLVSIARAFGVEIDSYGDQAKPGLVEGPLPQL